jgi:hypothetical protein
MMIAECLIADCRFRIADCRVQIEGLGILKLR